MNGVIIGFGNMGKIHRQCFEKLGVEITAVVDPAFKGKENFYPELEDVPNNFDFVDICSPSYLHFEHLQQAMKFQKPIFVEKPIVIKQNEVNSLRKTKYGKPIFIAEVEQFNPALWPFFNYDKTPKSINVSRNVNLDFFLKSSTPWFLDSKLSGGIVMDLMIHDLTLLVFKYGKPTVENVVYSSKKYGVVDNVSAVLKFSTFKATVEASWTSTDTAKPIRLDFQADDLKLKCDNYSNATSTSSPYYKELNTFIRAVKLGEKISLSPYLDAVEICLEINRQMVVRG